MKDSKLNTQTRSNRYFAVSNVHSYFTCLKQILEPNKTIVCGHYHTSWGHCHIDGRGSKWGKDALFSPFAASGILAIDACTAYSKTMNCFVLDHGPSEEINCE